MPTKRIAMLAQNEHDAASALLLARRLHREDWGAAELVSLDGFFQQGARRIFDDAGVAVRAVEPRAPLRAPFYRLPRLARLGVVLANQRRLSALAGDYDALVAGCDGALERVVINSMRAREKPTYLVLNALHFARPEPRLKTAARQLAVRLRLNHLFYSELGQGMCQRIFAPGEHSRAALCRMGVAAERIEVTGSPRFAGMLSESDPREAMLARLAGSGPVRLLYLMGAWEWHGLLDRVEQEMAQLSALAETALGPTGDFELAVRLHPRSSAGEAERVASIPGIEVRSAARPLHDDLRSSDVVLASASTGLLEAIALGRLVVGVDLSGIGRSLTSELAAAGIWAVEDRQALRGALSQLCSPGPRLERLAADEVRALWHFIAKETPAATGRIVDRLRADMRV